MNFLKSLCLAVILTASAAYGQITFTGAGSGGITYAGSNGVTVSGSTIGLGDSTNPATSLFINRGATAVEEFELSSRIGVGIPVGYMTPTTNNTAMVLDLFPKGTATNFSAITGAAWLDICSSDIAADGTNYECIRIGKFTSALNAGWGHISCVGGGTGFTRDLGLQVTGGNVSIGGIQTTVAHLDVHGSTNGAETAAVTNVNAGAAAFSSVEARNGASGNDGARLVCTGTAYTTNGAYVQDGAVVESGPNLSGGLSLISRAASTVRIYTGGIADATNLRLTISSTAATFIDDIVASVAGNGILIKEGTNATMGVATMVGGTVTVSTTKALTNSRIQLTVNSLGTVIIPRAVGVTARVNATSFTITSEDATDTSTVAWVILNPAP